MRALAVAVVAAAVVAGGAGAQTNPSFALGRAGGNIMPSRTTIASSGRVTSDGRAIRTLSAAKLQSLLKVAQTQKFFSLPTQIACPNVLPDVAGSYVTVHSGTRTRTVSSHGRCNARFDRVYDALLRATRPE